MMRSLFYFMASAVAIGTLVLVAGCAKNNGGGTDPGGVPGLIAGCPNNICVNNTTVRFASVSGGQQYGEPQIGSMTIMSGMQAVLEEAMGICNRAYSTGGLANCQSYMSGKVTLLIDADSTTSNALRIRLGADPSVNPNYWYSYSFPSLKDFFFNMLGIPVGYSYNGYFNPMILGGNLWPINNSQGFESRAYGPQGSYAVNKLFQLQVNGKLENTSLGYVLYYNGQKAAQGTLVRY